MPSSAELSPELEAAPVAASADPEPGERSFDSSASLLAEAHDPAADYAAQLLPESAGLVAAAPVSVAAPLPAQRINTFFGIGAVILLMVTVAVVVLLAIFVINILATR